MALLIPGAGWFLVVHCGMFVKISNLLLTRCQEESLPLTVTMLSQALQNVPWRAEKPKVEKHYSSLSPSLLETWAQGALVLKGWIWGCP